MLPSVREDFEAFMKSKTGGKRLQNNLRASSVGFACDRHHYYSLTEEKDAPSWKLQAIFSEGNLHEKDVEEKLRQMGYEVQGMQSDFRLQNPLISARIDGEFRKIGVGEFYPFDTKSISSWGFDDINSAEDVIHHKEAYFRNYATQILLYMFIKSKEYGCLIFKNKQTGELKDIWFSFEEHVSILDESLKRAERVYKAVAMKEPGKRTDDRSLCERCDFKAVCLPDLINDGGMKAIQSPELIAKLERREVLKTAAKEYDDVDTEVKKLIKTTGAGEKVCGPFLIQVKQYDVTRKVPLTWRDESTTSVRININKI